MFVSQLQYVKRVLHVVSEKLNYIQKSLFQKRGPK